MPSFDIRGRRKRDQALELRLSSNSEGSEDLYDSLEDELVDVTTRKEHNDKDSRRRPRKNVTFFPKATVRVVPKWRKKEYAKIWLSPAELSEIRRECFFTIQCMSLDNMNFFLNDEEPEFCGRGLENKAKGGEKRRHLAKSQSTKAVLDEQWSQWYGGFCDDEAIAKQYSAFTRSSQRLARVWGLKDEKEARTINR